MCVYKYIYIHIYIYIGSVSESVNFRGYMHATTTYEKKNTGKKRSHLRLDNTLCYIHYPETFQVEGLGFGCLGLRKRFWGNSEKPQCPASSTSQVSKLSAALGTQG